MLGTDVNAGMDTWTEFTFFLSFFRIADGHGFETKNDTFAFRYPFESQHLFSGSSTTSCLLQRLHPPVFANNLGLHAQGRLQACWITPIATAGIIYPLPRRNAEDFFNDLILLAFFSSRRFCYGIWHGWPSHPLAFSDSIPGGLGGDLANRLRVYYPIEGWAALLRCARGSMKL